MTIARVSRKIFQEKKIETIKWMNQIIPPENIFQTGGLSLYTWSDNREKEQFKIINSEKY